MARRRLEAAIQAGQAIEEGQDVGFSALKEGSCHSFDSSRDGVFSLQYSLDGSVLTVGFGDGSMEFLSSSTCKVVHETRRHCLGNFAIMCIRFNPAEQDMCLAGTSVGRMYACSTVDGTVHELFSEPGNEINCLDFCLDGEMFATAGKDLDIRLYDTKTSQPVKVYEGFHKASADQNQGHAQRVFSVRFHPQHNHLMVSGGWDNHLKIWDVRTRDGIQRTIHGPHICGDSLDLKGSQILTGSWRASEALQLWDFGEGSLITNLPLQQGQHGDFLYCAQFCDNDVVLAGGSGTNSIQAISLKSNEVVGEVKLDHPVQAMDSTYGGRLIALGGGGTVVKMASLQ